MTKLFLLPLSALLATVISHAQPASSAGYPWNGDVEIVVEKTALRGEMALRIRIPGWVRGAVVPSDLYTYADDVSLGYSVLLNGEKVEGELVNGYFVIARKWKKGDKVSVHFDMEPRVVKAHAAVAADQGRIAVERGPVVYCRVAGQRRFLHPQRSDEPAPAVHRYPRLGFCPGFGPGEMAVWLPQSLAAIGTEMSTALQHNAFFQ